MPKEDYLDYTGSVYRSKPRRVSTCSRWFPSASFYGRSVGIVYRASRKAKHGKYGDHEWAASSGEILTALERVGLEVEIQGIENVERLDTPCVFVGNHMSMLETMVLPIIIQSVRDVTFIVKESLTTYPFFGHVMRSRDPITVLRENAREDYKAVMAGGVERLKQGISIIVFPQTTRASEFDPEQFNSIGVKLAHKAKVPMVPIALLTDAWRNGRWLKDFGRIDPARKVRFEFGQPMAITGRGAEEHQKTIEFIQDRLAQWAEEDGGQKGTGSLHSTAPL